MLTLNVLDHSSRSVGCQHSRLIYDARPPQMKDNEKVLRQRLGGALREARLAKTLTQNQLAEALETDPETISRFERGATLPSLLRLLDLAEALGVTVASLLGSASPRAQDEWDDLYRSLSRLPARDKDLAAAILRTIVEARVR